MIVTADDFGLSLAVNEAVERAYREGVLTHASLMVAGPAMADAVRRAKRLPGLRVGLHVVAVEGPAVLPPEEIPYLVDRRGWFPPTQVRLAFGYFFMASMRRQLAREIRAQFETFAATGLPLSHADAHKHMQLHPTVGKLILRIGRDYGLPRLRVPAEPPEVMARCGVPPTIGARALHAWSGVLRRQARAEGVATNDAAFGIAWVGHMTEERLLDLLPNLPDGVNELYFHPATWRDPILTGLMPRYEHEAELSALLSPAIRAALNAPARSHAAASAGTAASPPAYSPG